MTDTTVKHNDFLPNSKVKIDLSCVKECKLQLPIPFKDNPMTNQSPCYSCIFIKPCLICNKANLYDLFEPAQTETSKRAATYKPRIKSV